MLTGAVIGAVFAILYAPVLYLGRVHREARDYEQAIYEEIAITAGVAPAEIKLRTAAHWQAQHPRLSRLFRYPDTLSRLPGTSAP